MANAIFLGFISFLAMFCLMTLMTLCSNVDGSDWWFSWGLGSRILYCLVAGSGSLATGLGVGYIAKTENKK